MTALAEQTAAMTNTVHFARNTGLLSEKTHRPSKQTRRFSPAQVQIPVFMLAFRTSPTVHAQSSIILDVTATFVSILLIGFQAAPPKPITTADLAKFDKKTVTVVGKIDKYNEKTSRISKKQYTVFTLVDAKGKVNVFLQGRPGSKFKDGDKVIVTGFYRKEKKVKEMVFKNEIDATNDKVKTNGVKLAK